MEEQTIQTTNTVTELEKLILCRLSSVGHVRHHKVMVAQFFENGNHTKKDIEGILLSWLGGEKWIAYNKERRGVSGDIYSTDVYNAVAVIFDHYTKEEKIFQGFSRMKSFVSFVEELSLQLKEYCDKYHRFGGLGQFEKAFIWSLYVSILKNVCRTNLAKLKICMRIHEFSSDDRGIESASYRLLVNTFVDSFPDVITEEQRQKMLGNLEVRWKFEK